MRAEVSDPDAGWQGVDDERSGAIREQDLATVARAGDPRRPIDLEPAIVVAGQVRLAGVQPHPDADRGAVRRRARLDRALRIDGGRHRGTSLREDRERGVSFGPHQRSAVLFDESPDEAHMVGVDGIPARAELTDEPHGALDVCPQERDRAGRQRTARRQHGVPGHWRLIRSASVWSIAIAASGRSRRIDLSPSPPMTSVRTSSSATTVATRGRSRRTANSPT